MDLKTQIEAARRSVLAVPRPDLATLEVSGADRISWLNGLLTCDLVKRAPGQALYGLVVARSGRVLSDAVVVLDGSEPGEAIVRLVVPSSAVAELLEHLRHYLVMEDVELTHHADASVAWALHGPRSIYVLAAAKAAGAWGGVFDATGLGGAIVLIPTTDLQGARAALQASITAAMGVVGDDDGWEALRIERAVPRFGRDFDAKTYPQEAGLERTAVSFDKGCYLGQEVVCMLEMRGHVKRKLVALVLDGALPDRGAPVTDAGGAAAGEVTSSALSPATGKPVALAMLKRAYTEPGTRLLVAGANALVVDRPA
jgi:hypothetical protein